MSIANFALMVLQSAGGPAIASPPIVISSAPPFMAMDHDTSIVSASGPIAASPPISSPSTPDLPKEGQDASIAGASANVSDPAAAAREPASVAEPDDLVVTARRPTKSDPLVAINAKSFKTTQAVDDALVAPISNAYTKVLPAPLRDGLHNFLSNLHEPVISLNYLLQLKPGKAIETLGRLAINSTFGIAGLLDVAKKRPFRLPFRPNGFANTFGYYGIQPGPFLFLPIVGATTPRDLVGLLMDRAVLPLTVGRPFNRPAYTIPTGLLHTLDRRVAFDAELRDARQATDPYVARRDLYLQTRQAEIDALHGRRTVPPAH